jgi:preprotein translocase subunit SecF
MARNDRDSFSTKLYRGEISYPIVDNRRRWYGLSGLVIIVGIVFLAFRGLNPSIDFKGGAEFLGPLNGHSITELSDAVTATGVNPEVATTTANHQFEIQTKALTEGQVTAIESAISTKAGIPVSKISPTTVGATWGSQITHKAIFGLIVFLLVVSLYLWVRFEWKMAMAAIVALIHDLIITAGIYSMIGLQVSPSTVIALLTILGYSLYDTVVVFDKVRENTGGITSGSRMTFTQASNFAVNQTLVRSINTSVIALLPVIGLLVIGVGVLGAGSLEDLAFALLIGLASGAYSSIFIATPLLCDFKEREPQYQQLAKRVASRRSKEAASGMKPAVAGAGGGLVAESATLVDEQGYAEDDEFAERAPADDLEVRTAPGPRPGARPPASQTARRRNSHGGRGGKSRKRR